MSRITDEYLSEVCRVISRGLDKGAFPMLDGVQVSWAVWLRHALDLDHIDTLEARVAELEGALREVAEAHFDLSLHKQHDTLSHLKHNAQKALAKLDGADEKP